MNEVNPPGGPPAGKVWIVGGPGCGKSTLAGLLAEPGAPPVRLDALFWGPGWTPVPEDRFLAEIQKALEARRWVVDGQFPAAVAAYAHTADCVVWVDPPLRVSWPRLLRARCAAGSAGRSCGAAPGRPCGRSSAPGRSSGTP